MTEKKHQKKGNSGWIMIAFSVLLFYFYIIDCLPYYQNKDHGKWETCSIELGTPIVIFIISVSVFILGLWALKKRK